MVEHLLEFARQRDRFDRRRIGVAGDVEVTLDLQCPHQWCLAAPCRKHLLADVGIEIIDGYSAVTVSVSFACLEPLDDRRREQ
jgi:hypothetical protein